MGITGFDVGFDFCALRFWQARNFCIYFSNAVVWVDAEFIEYSGVFFKYVFVIDRDRVTKEDRVGYFHHGGFEVEGE